MKFEKAVTCAILFFIAAFLSGEAHAEMTDGGVATILANVDTQVAGGGDPGAGFIPTIIWIAFGLGAFLTARGLMKAKEAADNPSQTKPAAAGANLMAGGALSALAATAQTVADTLGLVPSLNGNDADGFRGVLAQFSWIREKGIAAILGGDRVLGDEGALAMAWLLVVGLAAVSGVAMIAIAVHKLKEAGEGNPQTKASQAFSYGAIGGVLISLPSALQAAVDTLGLGAVEADAIATAGESHGLFASLAAGVDQMGAVQVFIAAAGAVAGIRMIMSGLGKLKEASDGRGKAATGLYYMLFGAALCVVPAVSEAFVNSLALTGGESAWEQRLSTYEGVGEGVGLASAANSVTKGMPIAVRFTFAVALLLSVLNVVKGLSTLAQAEDDGANRKHKAKQAITQVAAGSVLGVASAAVQSAIDTFGWDAVANAFSLASSEEGGTASNGLGSLLNIFQNTQANFLLMAVTAVCLAGGVVLVVMGVNGLKDADSEQHGGNAISPVMKMLAGAALVSLPAVLALGAQSFGLSGEIKVATAAYGTSSCSAGGWQCAVAGFAANAAGPLTTATLAVATVIGAVMVGSSLFGFAKLGSQGSREQAGALLTKLAVGAVLINSFSFADGMLSQTLGLVGAGDAVGSFSANAAQCSSVLAYKEGASKLTETQLKAVLSVCFIALYPFGLIAALRGLLMMKDHAEGNKQVGIGHAATFMLGGTALMNAHLVSLLTAQTLAPGSKMIETLKGMSDGGFSC